MTFGNPEGWNVATSMDVQISSERRHQNLIRSEGPILSSAWDFIRRQRGQGYKEQSSLTRSSTLQKAPEKVT